MLLYRLLISFKFNQELIDGDGGPSLDMHALNNSVHFTLDDVLHFHCLHDAQLLAVDNLVTLLHVDANDLSGHWTDDALGEVDLLWGSHVLFQVELGLGVHVSFNVVSLEVEVVLHVTSAVS